MYRRKLRASLLVLVPIFISGLASVVFHYQHVNVELNQKGQHFGASIADQLSLSVTDYLVNEDILSLNVVLTQLLARGHFDFASVYSADNQLLAQVGKRSASENTARLFTRDITWQNASVGHLQIGLSNASVDEPLSLTLMLIIAIHLAIAAVSVYLLWQYADLIYLWVALPAAPATSQVTDSTSKLDQPALQTANTEVVPETRRLDTIIMVFKLRPARLLPDYLPRVQQALALYRGDMAPPDGDTVLIYFTDDDTDDDAIFRAACSGLLLLQMFRLIDTPISIKLGLDLADAAADPQTLAHARKNASYLASNAQNCLLASQQVLAQLREPNRLVSSPFQSSLTPDGLVFLVEGLQSEYQALIQRQARQLLDQ